jgi:HEAT repeat protein
MATISDLIRLLDNPNDDETLDRVFGKPQSLNIAEGLLPHEDDLPYLRREIVCSKLAELGAAATDAVPSLVRCTEDDTDSTANRFTQLAAAKAIWEITGDAGLCVPIWERLLADSECWARRYAAELMEEIAHPAAIPALQSRLDDPRVEVQKAAKKAIEKIEGGSP